MSQQVLCPDCGEAQIKTKTVTVNRETGQRVKQRLKIILAFIFGVMALLGLVSALSSGMMSMHLLIIVFFGVPAVWTLGSYLYHRGKIVLQTEHRCKACGHRWQEVEVTDWIGADCPECSAGNIIPQSSYKVSLETGESMNYGLTLSLGIVFTPLGLGLLLVFISRIFATSSSRLTWTWFGIDIPEWLAIVVLFLGVGGGLTGWGIRAFYECRHAITVRRYQCPGCKHEWEEGRPPEAPQPA